MVVSDVGDDDDDEINERFMDSRHGGRAVVMPQAPATTDYPRKRDKGIYWSGT